MDPWFPPCWDHFPLGCVDVFDHRADICVCTAQVWGLHSGWEWASQIVGKVKDQDQRWKNTTSCGAELDVTPAVSAAAVCGSNPGKWRTALTVSSNLIWNLRRWLETFLLSAQLFPTTDLDSERGLFCFLPVWASWLGVDVGLTMLHPKLPLGHPRITRGKLQHSWLISNCDSERERWGVINVPSLTGKLGFSFGNIS